ncbi:hypothetical protein IB254_28905 [Pseudomonas sp. PDM03]|uniref:hypothetical protein n=1 Tax=Pseudomonas sp. PDM03 TaxID=2769266 RepID=UPI00177E2FEF|nr:hypothetical protein [Pseudomonas sp. PDM03]MBD9591111.1 hypothetical protein [Pseudomonas sp. PDM03]
MTVENRHDWEVAFRGLERFFDEGMTLWPKDKFLLLFPSEEIANSSYVLQQLTDLEKQGAISFVGADELYIKVLNI